MNNLLLAIITGIVTIASEKAFLMSKGMPSLLPAEKYIGLFIAVYLFTFVRNKKLRFIFLAFIPFLSLFQMSHLNYYGMPVYPTAIWLFFTQSGEIIGTLAQEVDVFLVPILICAIAIGTIFFAFKKLEPKRTVPFLSFLVLFYLAYNPTRTYVTGNTWGRQPSTQELMGMNIYLSSSYFLGKILPAKLLNDKSLYKSPKIELTKTTPKIENIIFIVGESLSSNHLSLFGYERKTSPYLDSLKTNENFKFHQGISSGVSSDVSVAYLLNNTFGLGGQEDVIKSPRCMFKLAKEQGFRTVYKSTQSQQQLRYITNSICPKFIDEYKNLEDLQPTLANPNAADDKVLLAGLSDELKKKGPKFIVLHKRGSHAPYNLRYPKNKTTFPMTGDYKQDRINHYDNSVLEFDRFMQELIQVVDASNSSSMIVYVSDHGEGLGEEGVWGHAALKKPSFAIPVLTYSKNVQENPVFTVEPTHLEVTTFILDIMGYKSSQNFPLKTYQILGNDMDGFSGFVDLNFDESGKLIDYVRKDI